MKPPQERLGTTFAMNTPAGRLRSVAAGVLCLLGIWVYATVVGHSYPLHEWLFWRLAVLWLYGALFVSATLTFGHALLTRLVGAENNPGDDSESDSGGLPFAETLVMSVAIGVLAFCLAMIGAGALGIIGPVYAIVMPLVFLAIGVNRLPRLLRQAQTWWATRPTTTLGYATLRNLAVGGAIVCLFLLYIQSMTPTAINYDASWYHMPVAEDYARTGKIFPMYADYNRAFPQLPSMLHTWAFSVPGLIPQLRWMLALQGEFLMVIWTIVGVVAGAEWMLRRRVPGLWAVFFLFPSIFVYDQNIGGSADHIVGFWAIPMLLATARMLERFERRWAILLGIAAAGAILSKLQAVYMIFACGSVIAGRFAQLVYLRTRSSTTAPLPWRTLITSPLWVIGVAALLTSPHFIKNVLFYGNPLHPFLQRHFPVWPVHENTYLYFEHAWALETVLPKGSTFDKIVSAVRLYFTYSFTPHRALNHNWPMLGSLFTLLLPCALLMKRAGRIWFVALVAFLSFFVWGYTYPNDRYVHALLPLTYALAAALIVRVWELGLFARIGLVPLVAFQIVWGADTMFYSGHKRMGAAVDLFRSGYEHKRKDKDRFPWRARELQIRDALPKDAKVLGRNYKATVGIDREILSDVQAYQSYFYYAALTSVRDLWELYTQRGVTHLLYPPGKRNSGVLKADILFAELVYRYATKKKRFPGLELVDMPAEPPPPDDRGYRVLAMGLRAYKNGLYDIAQFDIFERLPQPKQHKVDPLERLDSVKATTSLPMLARVDAVVVGKSGRLDAETRRALERDFIAAERFDVHTICLRKDRDKRAD